MDLFEGLDGLGGSGKKKLSLAEQLETKNKSTQNAFSGVDLLGGSSSALPNKPVQNQTKPSQLDFNQFSAPKTNNNGNSNANKPSASQPNAADDDIFGLFASAPPPSASRPAASQAKLDNTTRPQQSKPQESKSSPYTDTVETSYANMRAQSKSSSLLGDDNEYQSSNYRDQNPRSSGDSSRGSSAYSHSNPYSSSQRSGNGADVASDRKVAQLVDMGFEAKDANRALSAMNGDVRGSVSWLMAEAQGLPLPTPRSRQPADFTEFQAAASQIGASMFSKASSLFSKGRKELEKAYTQYQGSAGFGSSAGGGGFDEGQPAWLRDKARYESRKARVDVNDDPLPPRPSRRSEFSDFSKEPEIPRRDRSRESSHSSQASRESKPQDTPRRERPSRAELFRQQQEARKKTAGGASGGSSSGNTTRESTPQRQASPASNDLFSSSAAASGSQSSSSAPPVEEIDLLNLTSSAPAQTNLSSTETDLYATSRQLGSESFKRGNYEEAAENYSAALQIVKEPSLLRALLLSNRSAAYIKSGNTRGAFEDSSEGIKIIPNRGINQEVEGIKMNDIWVKLVTRNAQSAETMEKFKDALASWQLLLDNGFATSSILDAKRRCLKALNPETTKKAEQAPQKPQTQRRGWGTTGAMPTSAAGKAALDKVKSSHEKQAKEEKERDMLRDKVNHRVDAWKGGNETNLRVLLSTLQNVLWSECQWNPVNPSELVVPKKVRVVYMKAVARTHPDKIPSTASTEVKMISQSVFMAIQNAWETFKVENNI